MTIDKTKTSMSMDEVFEVMKEGTTKSDPPKTIMAGTKTENFTGENPFKEIIFPDDEQIKKESHKSMDKDESFWFREGARWMRGRIIELNK